jgi:hypothetical protein
MLKELYIAYNNFGGMFNPHFYFIDYMNGIIDLGYVPLNCHRLRTFQLKVQNNLSIT